MKYPYEFKRQVVNDYLSGRAGVLLLAKQYGIPGKSLVHQWIKAYREFGDDGLKTSWTKEVYDAEFKQKAVEQYLSSGESYEELAARLHIKNPATLNRWVQEYKEHGVDAWIPKKRGRPRKKKS
ncbi:MAG: transposase [Selenomonadaceae bacterium]|nr:transposase [Selenomonadaceae bacterium]